MNEEKFTGKAENYAKYRAPYSDDFIKYLYSEVGFSQNSIIADIGSGTGILTEHLLKQNSFVYGIEPNDDMRNHAEKALVNYNNYKSIKASAEDTTLSSDSIDYITVAQAFHWFDKAKFKTECNRILKPNGKILLVWNMRDFNAEWIKDGDIINRKYCPDYKGFNCGMRAEDDDDVNDFFTGKYETRTFPNNRILDLVTFIGGCLSSSYSPKENDENYTSYITEMEECFNKHSVDGKLIMPNVTKSYVGTV